MILCCGEALIDMLPRESAAGEAAFAPYPGGAVFNTAIALGRLGAPTGLFSAISTDLFGKILIDALVASGVDTGLALRPERPTTLAFVTLEDGQARYAFFDENSAGRMLSESELPALPEGIDALFFGGISLAVEPCAAAYEALALRERDRHVIMLDPNIRPGFIRDVALYRARLARMIAAADIVKLSEEDLFWLSGSPSGPDGLAQQARALLDLGPKLVFITEGAAGARGFYAAGEVSCPAPEVTLVDTVGAGDTFNAGVLAALSAAGALSKTALAAADTALLDACLRLGIAAAAVTVSRAGANPPWAKDLPCAL